MCVRILYKQFWILPRGKGGSKRNNNVPVSESLLPWLFKRKALNYCCFLSHCRHYRKKRRLEAKKKKAVRGFVAVFHTHALGLSLSARRQILGRNDREVSLMRMRHMKIAHAICISLCSAFPLFPRTEEETRGALAAVKCDAFHASFSARWENSRMLHAPQRACELVRPLTRLCLTLKRPRCRQ